MEQVNITAVFVKDHERMSKLLEDFKDDKQKTQKKNIEIINQLQNFLKKHFKEEELLYSKYKLTTGNLLPVIQTIKSEHKSFLESLDNMQTALKNGSTEIELFDIYHLLIKHKNVEERLLYPELDNALSDKEKEEVYWNIRMQ